MSMNYRPGKRSLVALADVHPAMVAGTMLNMGAKTTVDFGVIQGLRSYAEQLKMVERKQSRTMNSKHLRQDDGYSHAIDFRPVPGYEWEYVYPVVRGFYDAFSILGVTVRWGAVWDRNLNQLDKHNLRKEVENYVERYRKEHGPKAKPLIDGVHIELVSF